jgi:CRP/FNR family transcriptional regulator, cyclic AMP receptor protein
VPVRKNTAGVFGGQIVPAVPSFPRRSSIAQARFEIVFPEDPRGATRRGNRMRMTKKHRQDLLANVWLFEQCSRRELDVLQGAATDVDCPAGRVLAQQGEPGREFIVIVDGKAEVTRDGTHIAVLGSGSFFGEMSLLEGKPRTATVTALEPTRLLVLTVPAFNGVVASMPSVDRKMLIVLAGRLREIESKYVPVDERSMRVEIA